MYLVETGRFRVERGGVPLAEIGAGSVIGEIAFLTGGARTADVIAARNAVVLRIDRSAYDLLCATTPGLQQAIAAELAGASPRPPRASFPIPADPGRAPSASCHRPVRPCRRVSRPISPAPCRRARDAPDHRGRRSDAPWGGCRSARRRGAGLAERAGTEADTILFAAGAEADAWSRAVLHQADHADLRRAGPAAGASVELEELALELIPPTQRRLVLIHPHRMQRARGTAHWLATRPVFLHHHVALTEDGEDIARLARFLTGRAIGMVLSGGGAFGVAHVGRLAGDPGSGHPGGHRRRHLRGFRHGRGHSAWRPGGGDRAKRVEAIFVRSGAMRRVTVPKYAFLDHKVLDAALMEHYGDGPIEDLWLPYYAVAADLSAMSLTELRTGPLWEAVRASSAIPGILPPFFTSEGKMLVDGGCIDNMPFRSMHRLKTGPNVVVNVQKETGKVYHVDYDRLPGRAELLKRSVMPFGKGAPRAPGLISTVMRSLLVGQSDMLKALLPSDMMIRPPGLSGAGFLAWSQHKLFYEMAYKHAAEVFAEAREAGDPTMTALLEAAKSAP
jgi:NTE family protein